MSLPSFSVEDNLESCRLLFSIFLVKMVESQFDMLKDLFLLTLLIHDIHTKHHTYFDNPDILVAMDSLELKEHKLVCTFCYETCVWNWNQLFKHWWHTNDREVVWYLPIWWQVGMIFLTTPQDVLFSITGPETHFDPHTVPHFGPHFPQSHKLWKSKRKKI